MIKTVVHKVKIPVKRNPELALWVYVMCRPYRFVYNKSVTVVTGNVPLIERCARTVLVAPYTRWTRNVRLAYRFNRGSQPAHKPEMLCMREYWQAFQIIKSRLVCTQCVQETHVHINAGRNTLQRTAEQVVLYSGGRKPTSHEHDYCASFPLHKKPWAKTYG